MKAWSNRCLKGSSFDTTKTPLAIRSSKWNQLKHFCQNDSRSDGHTTYSGHYSIFLLNWWVKTRTTWTIAKWIPDTWNSRFWPEFKAIFSLMQKWSITFSNSLNNLTTCLARKHMSRVMYLEDKRSWLSFIHMFLKAFACLLACLQTINAVPRSAGALNCCCYGSHFFISL